jgi:hypothetical protein
VHYLFVSEASIDELLLSPFVTISYLSSVLTADNYQPISVKDNIFENPWLSSQGTTTQALLVIMHHPHQEIGESMLLVDSPHL